MLKLKPVVMSLAMLLLALLATAGFVGSSVSPATWFVPDGSTLTATQMTDLFDTNQLYFNVQSASLSTGEIRGEISPSSVIYQPDAGSPFAPNPAQNPVTFAALLAGDQVKPRNVETGASGYGSVTLNPLTKQLTGFIVTSGIVGNAAHICDGLPGNNGAIAFALEGGPVVWTVPANTVLNDSQMARLATGAYYFNVKSGAFPDGEIRGQLNQQVRFAALKGSNEVPPVASSAKGIGFLALNPVTKKLSGFVKVDEQSSAVTSAVIRIGDAATNGIGIINLVDSGNGIWSIPIINNPVLSDYVVTAFNNDALYVNIHTQSNPGGELRGQFMRSSIRIGTASLDGYREIPPVSTQATGTGLLAWNSGTEQVSGSVSTNGIIGTAANIHSGSVATNGPVIIPLTTTSPVTGTPTPGISFGLDIQPIFTSSCARAPFCHVPGGKAPMSLMSGVSYENIVAILVPGDSASSYLFQRISVNDPPSFPQMPLNRAPLSPANQALIQKWIDKGALFDFYPEIHTIIINGGATVTNSQTATLALNATSNVGAVIQMQFSKDGVNYFPFEPFATTRVVTLLPGDGIKTMYVRFKDAAGNVSAPVSDSITLDTTAPSGTITINSGAAFTNKQSATLTLSAAADVTQMQFSKDGINYYAFEPFAATRVVTLTPGDGLKTMYVRFKDAAGNVSAPVSDSITLDTAAPLGTIKINSGATFTNKQSATLTLSAAADVTQMQFSKDGINYFAFEPFATARVVTLTPGDGLKTMHVRFKDAAGNVSAPVSASITLDTTLPTGTIAFVTQSPANTANGVLALTATDVSSVTQMQFSKNGSAFYPLEPFAAVRTVALAQGLNTLTVRFKDGAGNLSATISATITRN